MKLNKLHKTYQEDLDYILSVKGIQNLRDKRFLITGATGLIGVCLIDALMRYNDQANANITIYAVGRNREKARERLGVYFNNPLFCFIEQDVTVPFPENLDVDFIFPCASNTHPLAYSKYPVETIMVNVKGAEYALNKAEQCGAMVLYPSTVEIYGNARGKDVFTEDYTGMLNLSTARSCYTESKRVCEAMCLSYMAEKNVAVKIARLSRVFGPTMLESDTKASSQFIKNALAGEDIILKSKGDQFFSYTYVADCVAALLYILLHGKNGESYNISNQSCNTHLKDFAQFCANHVSKQVIFELPSEAEQKGFSIASQAILDNAKLRNIGFDPFYNIENAINRTIDILYQS